MEYVKCHFDLDLNVKTCRDKDRILFRIKTLQCHIRKEFGPLQFAIRNLIGILYYHLGDYYQAFTTFETIIQEDPSNLNAIENLSRVCSRLQNSRKEAELSIHRNNIKISTAIMSRFHAEHAYAISFDVYETPHDTRRHSISISIFLKCLADTTGPEFQNEGMKMKVERAMWMLCIVWNYKGWCYKNFNTDSPKEKNEFQYPDTIKVLIDLKALVPDDEYFQCMVWGYLGYFFWKKPEDAEHDAEKRKQKQKNVVIPEIVRENGLIEYFRNPELCFKKSLGIREEKEAMQLYMGWLKSMKRYDLGLKLLNKCIKIDKSEANYFSYSKRGELMVERCKQRLAKGTRLKDLLDDLQKSIDDFKFVAQVNPSSYTLGYLGTVYGIASDKGKDEAFKAHALCAFQRGLDCLNGPRDPWLHFKHARYLNEIGEYDSALDVIKSCVECRYVGSKCFADLEYLLNWYVEKMSRTKNFGLISELVYWFCDVAFPKYNQSTLYTVFKTFLLKNLDKIIVDLSVQIFLKNDKNLNQFLARILREDEISAILKKNFDATVLTLMLERSSQPQHPTSFSLKRSNSSQPKNREGFSYDFFVIYSDKDREWVLHSLMNRLENIKNFKGYLDHRDFTPGKSILENIERAISNSYRSIFVISPNFLASHWCQHESQSALTRALNQKTSGSIIPIVKDNAKVPEFLITINHIALEESLDEHQYERLVKALEG